MNDSLCPRWGYRVSVLFWGFSCDLSKETAAFMAQILYAVKESPYKWTKAKEWLMKDCTQHCKSTYGIISKLWAGMCLKNHKCAPESLSRQIKLLDRLIIYMKEKLFKRLVAQKVYKNNQRDKQTWIKRCLSATVQISGGKEFDSKIWLYKVYQAGMLKYCEQTARHKHF